MKIKNLLVTLLVTSSFCTQLWASECNIGSELTIVDAFPAEAGRKINCDYVQQVQNIIEEIQKISEDKVPVSLMVRAIYSGASFDGGTIIDVPERLIFSNQYAQEFGVSLSGNLSVVAHEYGHALLRAKMERSFKKNFPEAYGYMQARKEVSALSIKLMQNPDSVEYINLLKEKEAAITGNKKYMDFFILHLAYSELYADVVAVYTDNSKNSIFSALYYNEMSNFEYKYVQTRSFDSEFDNSHAMYMSEPHSYFALTRNYIGKKMWPKDEAEKKVMLEKIGDAIVAELADLLKSGSSLPDYEEGNQRLIKRLSKKDSKSGILK